MAAKPVDSVVVEQEAGQSQSTEETRIDDVVADEVEQRYTETVVSELAEKPLVDGEVEGETLGGSAVDKGTQELSVLRITENIPKTQLAQSTRKDPSLQNLVRLAEAIKEGYYLTDGVLFRTRLDQFGQTKEQICLPTQYRQKCLTVARNHIGHHG